MKLRKAVLIAFALSAVSGAGFAAGEKGTSAAGGGAAGGAWPSFSELDKGGTGSITKEDAQQVPGLDFSSADADGDGKLSRSEYEAAKKAGEKSPGSAPSPGGPGGSPGGMTR